MKTKFPWLTRRRKTDPELPLEPPLWMKSCSNGEYFHFQTAYQKKLREFILRKADDNARRVGMDRREFLASAMGMVTTLWCINTVSGCSSSASGIGAALDGGTDAGTGPLCVPPDAMFDPNAACEVVAGDQFIFDVQTHWFNSEDTRRFPPSVLLQFGPLFTLANENAYINSMFLQSETTMSVLTSWPGTACPDDPSNMDPCGLPLSNESMLASRDKINQLASNTQRVVQHFQLLPKDPTGIEKQKELMTRLHCERGVSGWKMYPGFNPGSIDPRAAGGYFLDEAEPRQIIEHGLALGLNRFCVHKGLPIGSFFDKEHNHPRDIGVVAKAYPQANFIIYHSGICSGFDATNLAPPEGPYDPDDPNPVGVNALIRSLAENGIGPNQNVYAEVGSAINQVQSNAMASAHFFGKLMKYVGTDRVVWGTDCVIYGSPQPYIEWFRNLSIPEELQQQYGYPPLDATNRAKIFGLNSAKLYGIDVAAKRCRVQTSDLERVRRQLDEEYGPRRWAFQEPGGPKNWSEYVEHSQRAATLGRPG
jgi:predicted TIM-barrel fold metal-dependent hydrolase